MDEDERFPLALHLIEKFGPIHLDRRQGHTSKVLVGLANAQAEQPAQPGCSSLLLDGALESAIAQPKMTVGDLDLYPSLVEKAAALCFSLVANHPFVDGNKRVAHAALTIGRRPHGVRLE